MTASVILVLDSETTGLEAEGGGVVEVAAVALTGEGSSWEISAYAQSLVNPGVPIPPAASAVHQLTDHDVQDAPPLRQAALKCLLELSVELNPPIEEAVVAAHNAEFDQKFLVGEMGFRPGLPWICTYRCAKHIWEDAPSHGNLALRYYLGLNVPDYLGELSTDSPEFESPVVSLYDARIFSPHRALYDALVTSHLLMRMLGSYTPQQLVDMTAAPILYKRVGFGQHYGKLWSEVPRDYLSWILNKSSGWDPDTLHTAKHHYTRGLGVVR